MANLNRGITYTITSTVTSASLHQLIENATLSNIGAADFTTGVAFVSAGTATPNPSLFPMWLSTDPQDPVFRVFAAPWNIWCAVGPDRFELPFLNSAATTGLQGALVIPGTGASSFQLGSNPSINVLGFLQSQTPADSYGPVAILGYGYALFASSISLVLGGALNEQYLVYNTGCPPGCVAGVAVASSVTQVLFGMWLEAPRSGFTASFSPNRLKIYGPKAFVGFP
jgi:hypothetical protein